jgi:hypothetical protein
VKHELLLALAVATLPAFGEEHRQAAVAPISLYAEFKQSPPPALVAALHEELDVIMLPIGIEFDWRTLDDASVHQISVELAVVTFKGRCDAADLLPLRSEPAALGWTHVSDGEILPFSVIDCDRVRDFLQHDLLAVAPARREFALGRSLARVLAHELYHIFANTAKHAPDGIAKRAYTVRDLLSDDFQFEAHESETLRGKRPSGIPLSAGGTM